MHTSIRFVLFAALAFGLLHASGCARTQKTIPEAGYSVHVEKAPSGYELPTDVEDITDIELPARPSEEVQLQTPISGAEEAESYGVIDRIHFDYDKSDIKAEFIDGLQNNARWMREHPGYQMLIEGHCDERGTNEYNMALGERRAMAARNYLIQQGVDPDRVHIKSWGEEKPLAFGHDESSWWQNRRAEFLVGLGSEE